MTKEQKQQIIDKIKELSEQQQVSEYEKSACLEAAINSATDSHNQPFLGHILQSLDILYTTGISTAGVTFSTDKKKFMLFINPIFFCKILNMEQRVAVLYHELYHLLNKHVSRIDMTTLKPKDREMANIAADMAINQYIKNLPEDCINVDDYYDEVNGKKVPWEKFKSLEYYLEKLKKLKKDDPKNKKQTLDDHNWSEGSPDEKEVIDAVKDLITRTMHKTGFSHNNVPDVVRDFLKSAEQRVAEIDYKYIILSALKRSLAGIDRKPTWNRASRRYGYIAPGSTVGDLPKLKIVIDTSGSISYEEVNSFLNIVDEFLRNSHRKCDIVLFHTKVYYRSKYVMGERIAQDKYESGGTDLTEALMEIQKTTPNLAIILTDGYFDDVHYESWMRANDSFPQTVFIISKEGNKDHPLKRLGRTIHIP